jgi:hypothetical protein
LARHQFAVLALAVLALASSFWWLLDLLGDYSRNAGTFGVAAFDGRFINIRKTIAPNTVFGYFSDNPEHSQVNQAEYYLTQYALAPALVVESANTPLVVANTHAATPNVAALQAAGLALVQDFGNGILLCRRIKQ